MNRKLVYAKWVLAFHIKYWISIHVFWIDFDFQGLYLHVGQGIDSKQSK